MQATALDDDETLAIFGVDTTCTLSPSVQDAFFGGREEKAEDAITLAVYVPNDDGGHMQIPGKADSDTQARIRAHAHRHETNMHTSA